MPESIDTTKFNELVAIYERLAEPLSRPSAVRAVQAVGLTEGARVLDVATGTGVLAVLAAEKGARVLATDLNPGMVGRAGERLRDFPGCASEVMPADALAMPAGRFDAAFSAFGILMLPTWRRGLEELVRVTRPGGRISVSTWTSGPDAAPAYLLRRVFEARFPDRKLWPDEGMPSWSADSLRGALLQAGCADVAIETVHGAWTLPATSATDQALGRALDENEPLFRLFPGYAALTEAERHGLRGDLAQALDAYGSPDGTIRMPTEAYVAVAVRTI